MENGIKIQKIIDKGIMFRINDYLMIKEAAKFLGVTSNTLRNWEAVGKIRVYRNPQNNYRLYKKGDLELLLQKIKPFYEK